MSLLFIRIRTYLLISIIDNKTNPIENQNKLELISSSNHRHPSNKVTQFKRQRYKEQNLKKGNTRQPKANHQQKSESRERFAIF